MEDLTLYLRTALFSVGGSDAHVPPGVLIVDGKLVERLQGALLIQVTALKNERGKVISEHKPLLELPWSKVDHIERKPAQP